MTKIVLNSPDLEHTPTSRAVPFQHNLSQNDLFVDTSLAHLIDIARAHGPDFYTLGSLGEDGFGQKWQTGILGDMSGTDVLAAIKKGHLWLQLQGLKEIAPEYFALAEQGFADLKKLDPSFDYHKLRCNVLISSPTARVLCHLDCAEVVLWHIRGRKRIYLYDLTKQEFASELTIEKVILRETQEDIPYKPEWDEKADIYDLEPGQAVNWPLFWPHRIDNIEGLNVSMQTEFYSSKGVRQYGVRFANGVLRRKAGLSQLSTSIAGPVSLAKTGLGFLAKKLALHKQAERKIVSHFAIDQGKIGSIKMISN